MIHLVAFTGLIKSGKSTAADHLVANCGFVRVSFAAPIRRMLEGLGLTPEELQARKEQPLDLLGGRTPRFALQTLGTEWGREKISPDLWVNATERTISKLFEEGRRVVIDDCRFDNEARAVRNLGGLLIRVARTGLIRGSHPSEQGVSPPLVDRTIHNDESVDSFLEAVAQVVG